MTFSCGSNVDGQTVVAIYKIHNNSFFSIAPSYHYGDAS